MKDFKGVLLLTALATYESLGGVPWIFRLMLNSGRNAEGDEKQRSSNLNLLCAKRQILSLQQGPWSFNFSSEKSILLQVVKFLIHMNCLILAVMFWPVSFENRQVGVWPRVCAHPGSLALNPLICADVIQSGERVCCGGWGWGRDFSRWSSLGCLRSEIPWRCWPWGTSSQPSSPSSRPGPTRHWTAAQRQSTALRGITNQHWPLACPYCCSWLDCASLYSCGCCCFSIGARSASVPMAWWSE